MRGPAIIWARGLERAAQAGRLTGHLAGLAGVAVVTALIVLAGGRVNELSMGVCYQLLVLAVSGAFGTRPGLVTSLASVAAFNFFFIPPTGTLTIGDEENWISLAVFAATAVVTSRLAAGSRRQRRESEARRRDSDLLAELAETILGEMGPTAPGPAVEAAAARALGVSGCHLVLTPAAAPAPAPTPLRPAPDGFTVPLVAGGRPLGLLEVGAALPDAEPRWARPGLAIAVAGLAAVAVERARLIQAALETESLRRSDLLKTALLHGVSHEFRTPITAIRTAAHALRDGPGADVAAALLAVMAEETERLDRLVANLLDLSRLEAGALVARLDWCAPSEMVAGALDEAEVLVGGRPVEVDVPVGLPLVRADALLAERILVNLLHNAVRHGAGPIRVTGRVQGEAVELAVSDEGPGVDAALAARLFRPFAPGGPTGGTGIGLALSRGLADAQGASLRHAAGAPGARFVLAFPLVTAPDGLVTGARLLVVDDEPQVLRSLSAALAAAGYAVATAATGAEALAQAARSPVDAVVLDLRLPDGSGLEVCRRLREWSQAPIVVVSAVDDEDEKIAALDAGADDYVTKPYAVGELLARVRAALRRAAAPAGEPPTVAFGDVEVDLAAREVRRAAGVVHLTPHEYGLLAQLARHPDRVQTHRALLVAVWGPEYVGETHYLRVYMGNLRKKLEEDPGRPRHLVTETGVGYRLRLHAP